MKKKIIVAIVMVIILGFIFGLCQSINLSIKELNTSYLYLFANLLLYLIIYGLSFIGLPVYIITLLYETFSLGIMISFMITNFQLSYLFYLIFFLSYKIIIIFLLLLTIFYHYKYLKHLCSFIIKRGHLPKHNINLYYKKMTIIIIFILIINIIFSLLNIYVIIPLLNKIK